MKDFIWHFWSRWIQMVKGFLYSEKGETNIIAIILIIVIVLGLVVIFRSQITNLIENLFNQIDEKRTGL